MCVLTLQQAKRRPADNGDWCYLSPATWPAPGWPAGPGPAQGPAAKATGIQYETPGRNTE